MFKNLGVKGCNGLDWEVLDRANPERAIEDSISHVFLAYDWPSLSN